MATHTERSVQKKVQKRMRTVSGGTDVLLDFSVAAVAAHALSRSPVVTYVEITVRVVERTGESSAMGVDWLGEWGERK